MAETVFERDELDLKANDVFSGKVVRKDLVRKVKVGANVPVFVLEYLLGKYCASSDQMAIDMGLQVVNDTLADNYIRPDESNKAQSKVKEKGSHDFIDKVKVRLVDSKYWAEVENFGHKKVHIPDSYVVKYERLLTQGIWAQVKMRFEVDEDSGGRYPFWIEKLSPIQIAYFNLEEYQELRKRFSTEEWINLVMRSMGYEPQGMETASNFFSSPVWGRCVKETSIWSSWVQGALVKAMPFKRYLHIPRYLLVQQLLRTCLGT